MFQVLQKDQATALPEKNENVTEKNTENEPSSIEQALSIEETLQKEINHMKDQLLRSLAEAENIRKRTQREKEEARQYAVTNFARDLLNIADNLNRALQVWWKKIF